MSEPILDALIEDSLARADAALGVKPRTRAWSIRVRLLRWVATRGRAPAQRLPL